MAPQTAHPRSRWLPVSEPDPALPTEVLTAARSRTSGSRGKNEQHPLSQHIPGLRRLQHRRVSPGLRGWNTPGISPGPSTPLALLTSSPEQHGQLALKCPARQDLQDIPILRNCKCLPSSSEGIPARPRNG